jgi:uncharacterized protein
LLDSPEAIVVTGLRRTAKTTLLRSLMGEITTDNKLFLDLENPASRKLKTEFQIRFDVKGIPS